MMLLVLQKSSNISQKILEIIYILCTLLGSAVCLSYMVNCIISRAFEIC